MCEDPILISVLVGVSTVHKRDKLQLEGLRAMLPCLWQEGSQQLPISQEIVTMTRPLCHLHLGSLSFSEKAVTGYRLLAFCMDCK